MAASDEIWLRIADWEAVVEVGSFEDVFSALEAAVARLELGNLPLEPSLRCYEVGARLAQRCEQILDEAELRVARIELLADQLADAVTSERGNGDR